MEDGDGLEDGLGDGFWDAAGYLVIGAGLLLLALMAFDSFSDPEFWVEMWREWERCQADPGCPVAA